MVDKAVLVTGIETPQCTPVKHREQMRSRLGNILFYSRSISVLDTCISHAPNISFARIVALI